MKWSDGPVTLENSQHRYYGIKEFGYLRWRHYYQGKTDTVYVHQLVAIADGEDPYDIFSNGRYVVHHGSDDRFSEQEAKCPLFNWIENIQLEEDSIHGDYHMNGIRESI